MEKTEFWTCTVIFLIYVTATTTIGVKEGVCLYRKWERPGDVKFLVIAGIRESDENGACGNTSRTIFEEIVALEWIVGKLTGNGSKEDSFIPGLTIGYDLYDNCDNEDLTTDLLYSGLNSGQEMNCNATPPETSVYIGAISLTTPRATNIIARLLEPLPVFRPLMSSPVLKNHEYQNLLQSVVSFQDEVTAITQMLSSIGWKYIVVVHTEDANEEADVFTSMARSAGICVKFTGAPVQTTVSKIFTIMNLAYNKSISVVYFGNSAGAETVVRRSKTNRPYNSKIHWVFTSKLANAFDIEDELSSADSIISVNLHASENMEFIDFFANVKENPSDTPLQGLIQKYNFSSQDSVPEKHPYPMVDAILSTISAAKDIWETECVGQNSLSDCSSFQSALEADIKERIKAGVIIPDRIDRKYLPTFYNKTLRYNQDGTQKYDSLHMNLYTNLEVSTIGEYRVNQYIPSANIPVLPTSACRLECTECQEQTELRYSYLHGDFLIIGLFSLRTADTASPFTCGQIRRGTNDIITVSAFIQSVIIRRNQTGVNFGAIAIDDCYNGLNTSHYLSDLFSKRRLIKDPANPGRTINFDNVVAIVGALSSPVTLIVADLSQVIKLPVLSYSASSPDLDNRNRYPYFLRTVPSDTLQVQGMVSFVVHLRVSHVGLVYIDDAYGQGGKLRLEQEALSLNICVEDPISVTQNMDNEYIENQVIQRLYHQQVRVVLLFAIDSVAQKILDVMNEKFSTKYDPLVFISSEGWGQNRRLLNTASLGSVIFNLAAQPYSNEHYRLYLQNLRPFNDDENRWLPRFFEDYNQCDFLSSFEKTFSVNGEPTLCTQNFKSVLDVNTTKSLAEDQRYVHTMLSVFAVTDGFQNFCKTEGTCSPGGIRNKLGRFFTFIKTSRYLQEIPIFDEDGNGHIGYTVYNIQREGSVIVYKQVGSYHTDGKLNLSEQPKFYNDLRQEISLQDKFSTEINCYNYIGTCSDVCPMPETTTPVIKSSSKKPNVVEDDKNSSLMTMTIVFGVFMAVLLVALVFVVVILVRIQSRQIKQLSDRGDSAGHTTSLSDTHSVYDEPGSVKRKGQFDNLVFMPDTASLRSRPHTPSSAHGLKIGGSVSSLNNQQPIQYSHIRQMSNPDIHFHHVRQVSNQELRSQWFDSLERPTSTLSAPTYKPQSNQRSPFVKRLMHTTGAKPKPYKQTYSPKTPHSAPTGTRQPVVYRQRAQSSPRFRYPSTVSSDESHYTLPKLDSYEEMAPQRKMGVSDESVNEHIDDAHDEDINFCNAESYLYPNSSAENEPQITFEPDSKITYLTAKDLVTNDSEDEDEIPPEEADGSVQYFGDESQSFAPVQGASADTKILDESERLTSITSPTDNEVMNINFPPKSKAFHLIIPNTQQGAEKIKSNTTQNQSREVGSAKKAAEENDRESQKPEQTVVYQKTNSRSSITDVPDVIKHGAYEEDGVFII